MGVLVGSRAVCWYSGAPAALVALSDPQEGRAVELGSLEMGPGLGRVGLLAQPATTLEVTPSWPRSHLAMPTSNQGGAAAFLAHNTPSHFRAVVEMEGWLADCQRGGKPISSPRVDAAPLGPSFPDGPLLFPDGQRGLPESVITPAGQLFPSLAWGSFSPWWAGPFLVPEVCSQSMEWEAEGRASGGH